MGDRISIALTELLRAHQEVYGENVTLSVGFDIVLGNTRTDLSKSGIDDFIGEEPDGNK